MPRTKTNTTRTVAEIKQQYDKDQERAMKNFDEAIQGLKQLKNPNRSESFSITQFDREAIRGYLQAPGSNESNLRNAAKYLYYRSQIFSRIILFYASMWDLKCRQVIPNYDLTKDNDATKMLKTYNATLDMLDIYKMHENFYDVLVNCYLYDVCYTIFFRDDTGAFFYILNPEECKIDGRYMTGDLSFSLDMSKWRGAARREIAEWLGSPLSDMLAEYDRTGERWIHMPDEYGVAFKFRSDNLNNIIPPFSALLQQLAGLNDTEDIQAIADEQSIYKLLLLPMKVLSGAKQSDDFEVSPDLLLKYFDRLLDVLPSYISAAPIPGDGLSVVDFSTTSADKDIDRLSSSQKTILSIAGGGAVLDASNINSNAAFAAWLKAESEFAISSLMPQIQGATNRFLGYDVSNPCKVRYFEVTIYTKDDVADKLLTSCQHSFSNRLAYNTFLGISEKATMAIEFLETNVLNLPGIMNHPLQSSYTTSNSNSEEAGRPLTDDRELTDSGERSRNA